MKRFLVILFLTFLFIHGATAQQTRLDPLLKNQANPEEPGISLEDVINHIGSEVYVRDTIMSYKIISDSIKLLYLGGKYPNQMLTIVIKGKKLNKQLVSRFTEGIGHFSGKAILYEGKPAIIIISDDQLGVRIQI